jgi:hypothetical protein
MVSIRKTTVFGSGGVEWEQEASARARPSSKVEATEVKENADPSPAAVGSG